MPDTLTVFVNGKALGVRPGLTLGELVQQLGLSVAGMLVEVNREVLPKDAWLSYPIKDGDRVELLRITAGG
jgi:sulfur carrier protein